MAKRSDELAGLVEGLAHGLRSPMNAALLHLSLAERLTTRAGVADVTAVGDAVGHVRGDLGELERRLQALLEVARAVPTRAVRVELRPLLGEIVAEAGVAAQVQGRAIELVVTDELAVEGDRTALARALVALIDNAVEAAGARVQVMAARRGRRAIVAVTDDGPLTRPEVRARIVEPFFSTKPGALGFGAAYAQAVILGHRGRLAYRAGRAGGLTASVVLPLARGARGASIASP